MSKIKQLSKNIKGMSNKVRALVKNKDQFKMFMILLTIFLCIIGVFIYLYLTKNMDNKRSNPITR